MALQPTGAYSLKQCNVGCCLSDQHAAVWPTAGGGCCTCQGARPMSGSSESLGHVLKAEAARFKCNMRGLRLSKAAVDALTCIAKIGIA